MPYTKSTVKKKIPSTKSLTDKQLDVFVTVINDELDSGTSEADAIKKAYGATKRKKTKKEALIEKFTQFLDSAIGDHSPDEHGLEVLQKSNEELRIETSVVYLPNTLDAHGEWMSKSTVATMRDRLYKGFLEDGTLSLNLWHDPTLLLPKEECEVLDVALTKSEMYDSDGHYIPEGTCIMTVKYHNERLWEMRKEGIIGGFSIHGKRDFFPGEYNE